MDWCDHISGTPPFRHSEYIGFGIHRIHPRFCSGPKHTLDRCLGHKIQACIFENSWDSCSRAIIMEMLCSSFAQALNMIDSVVHKRHYMEGVIYPWH